MQLANKVEQRAKSKARIVCIVDDDNAVRDSLAFLLRAYGLRVKTYASGAELLAERNASQYACIVLDIHMPTMDGLGVLKAITRRAPGVPVILISGLVDPSLGELARSAGAANLLLKPLDSEVFLAEIDRVAKPRRPAGASLWPTGHAT